MLKDYSKIIYQFNKDNQRISQIKASIIDQQLIIQRIDFNDWEYSPRTGKVIGYDTFDEENTSKLALRLRAFTLRTLFVC